ncbi:MAG: T9SS type A sorting domain-containing protein [Saprospiraceae bacterium]|nr:T9SS type A sorting domain-containing protein [Saprospiraceae bacterium]
MSFIVSMDLTPGSPGGDNVYTACEVIGNGPGSLPGQGLYNKAEVDRTGDGITDIADDACGDIPYITMVKNFNSVIPKPNGSFTVNYSIVVSNLGGASGTYNLKDTPLFDNDVVITSGFFSGQASGSMNTSGSTTLATNITIGAGDTHTYNVSFNVIIDLTPGTPVGDNIYYPCEVAGNGPGSWPGQGLYNKAELDWTSDNITDITDDACGDLPGSIGDFVWHDINANGVQDGGEPGISGVTVTLTNVLGNPVSNANGNPVLPTITASDGSYHFTNLAAGQYKVVFGKPLGYVSSPQDQGSDFTDSDVNPTTGESHIIDLQSAENDNSIDAGYYQLASIGDFVWEDLNGNGIQDAGEPAIQGAIVSITGVLNFGTPAVLVPPSLVLTNALGFYQFNDLVPGTYTVVVGKPAGYEFTPNDRGGDDTEDSDSNPATGVMPAEVLVSGEINLTYDAGLYKPASIGDFVWEDMNGNGIQEPGEPGLEDVVVLLNGTTGTGQPFDAITITDVTGFYEFANLAPGIYNLTFGTLTNYAFTIKDAPGSTDVNDSDVNPADGQAGPETLVSGEHNPTYDAGLFELASIGDRVWLDANGNGLQDVGEVGVNNIPVKLYRDTNGDGNPDGASILTTSTQTTPSGDGYYLFSSLAPGKYLVGFELPSGYLLTQEDITGFTTDANDVNNDSDVRILTGYSHSIVILSGENDFRIDAGVYQPLSLGDFVWEDFNNSGHFDVGEQPFIGVEVALWKDLDNDGQPDFDTGLRDVTDVNGQYLFTNLAPGHYVVQVLPSNFAAGEILYSYTTSTGNGLITDPDNDVNNDDNGFDPGLFVGFISRAITLTSNGEPTNDGDANANTNLTVDFGFFRLSAIGDYVWNDKNANGIQDGNESGVNNVKVYLYRSNGTLVDTMRTMSNPFMPAKQGYYTFDFLTPGDYYVKFDVPAGYIKTPANKPGDDTKDSDVDGTMGVNTTAIYTLSASERDFTVDFGIYEEASIGDYIWIDYMNMETGTMNNAIQDPLDLGVNGILVTLFDATNNTVVNQMLTLNNPDNGQPGWYLFDKLPSATYYIKVALPQGYIFVTPNAGVNDMIDSDVVDFINGTTLPLLLLPGEHIRDLDAGIKVEVILPVELVDFYGKYNDRAETNDLTWITASEVNNEYFEVMRSLDGKNFEAIGKVEGAGNSSAILTYNFVDDKLIDAQELYYYQLRQVDYDGAETLSDVVTIKVPYQSSRQASIYPNPATDFVSIKVTGNTGDQIQARIFDNAGKLVMTLLQSNLAQNVDYFKADISGIPSGVYMVNIQVAGSSYNHKLIILE